MTTTYDVHTGTLRPTDRHPTPRPTTVGPVSRRRRFFGVVTRPATYRNLAYLLLGLPLGTVWFSALVTAVSVGASMVVVALVGVPLLVATWYLCRVCANVERAAANRLLGEAIPYAPLASGQRGNPWARLRALGREPLRRREAAFLLLRFPAGVATFTAATTALTVPLWVAWAPIQARLVDHPFGEWAFSTEMEDVAQSAWSWFCVPAGLLALFVAFHALNGLARASGRWAASSLGAGE